MVATQARAMAAYNRWMNERIYDICAGIPDDERKRERNAFFHSIHGTLNHLLLGDKIWLGRFEGIPYPVDSLDQELFTDFNDLWTERRTTDQRIEEWAAGLSDKELSGQFSFTSIVNPALHECELWVAVTHFFNHQTHHRGQLTTLLSQSGHEYGTTDLIWLPGLMS